MVKKQIDKDAKPEDKRQKGIYRNLREESKLQAIKNEAAIVPSQASMKVETKTAQKTLKIPKLDQEQIKERKKVQMIQKIRSIFENEKE